MKTAWVACRTDRGGQQFCVKWIAIKEEFARETGEEQWEGGLTVTNWESRTAWQNSRLMGRSEENHRQQKLAKFFKCECKDAIPNSPKKFIRGDRRSEEIGSWVRKILICNYSNLGNVTKICVNVAGIGGQ